MQQITARETAPGRTDVPRGRWIWYLSGVATITVGAALITFASVRAGNADGGGFTQMAVPSSTVVVNGMVTSLNIDSYGSPIVVSRGPVNQVTIVETVSFSQKVPPKVMTRLDRGGLTLAAPSCENNGCSVGFAVTVPSSFPDVTVSASSEGGGVSVSGVAAADIDSGGGPVTAGAIAGELTVTAEGGGVTVTGAGSASLDSGGGTVSVSGVQGPMNVTSEDGEIDANEIGSAILGSGGGPVNASDVSGTLTVTADGGSINVDGAAGANLNSGGGPVVARSVDGPLSATTDGGSLLVDGLTGALSADTGGGPLTAGGITSAAARASTDGGTAWLSFAAAPRSVQVTTDSGAAVLVLPGGPYAVDADSSGGSELVTVPVSATSARIVSVTTSGGELQVKPPATGS